MGYTYIAHYGIKDMKWGVRRYQNSDGSYTSLGRMHYGIGSKQKKLAKDLAIGALKGIAIGAIKYSLSMANPAVFGATTVAIIGKQVVKSLLSKSAGIAVGKIVGSESTSLGKIFIEQVMKRARSSVK